MTDILYNDHRLVEVLSENSCRKTLLQKLTCTIKLSHTLMDVETSATCHFHSQEGNT